MSSNNFDKPLLEDPFFRFFDDQDDKHPEFSKQEFSVFNRSIPSNSLFGLLMGSVRFKADNQDAFISSTSGPRGSGKSLGSFDLGLRISHIYGVPMTAKDVLYDPYTANISIRNKAFRTTSMVDESFVAHGIGAGVLFSQLEQFEHEGRYTQKNVLWVSIEDKYHPHEFKFYAQKNGVKRVSNPICNACPFYSQCKTQYYTTLCQTEEGVRKKLQLTTPVHPSQRTGYPIYFEFEILTRNRHLRRFVYRGSLKIPMIDYNAAMAYDTEKRANIQRMQNFQTDKNNYMTELANKVFDAHFGSMVESKAGKFKTVGRDRITMFVEMATSDQLSYNARKQVIEMVKLKVEQYIRDKL